MRIVSPKILRVKKAIDRVLVERKKTIVKKVTRVSPIGLKNTAQVVGTEDMQEKYS